MDSDEVNSVGDTTESRQVLNCIRTAYFNILTRANLPEHIQTFNLDASTDAGLPVILQKPSNVTRIDYIKYLDHDVNTNTNMYKYVTVLPYQQFIDMTQTFNPTESNVASYTLDGVTYYYQNDRQPLSCTIYKNDLVLFDNYNSAIDSTLQSSKTLCVGQLTPAFELVDSFTPNLDDRQFPLLLNEATSLAFLELKQIVNEASSTEARRQWQNLQRVKNLKYPSAFNELPNYSRIR